MRGNQKHSGDDFDPNKHTRCRCRSFFSFFVHPFDSITKEKREFFAVVVVKERSSETISQRKWQKVNVEFTFVLIRFESFFPFKLNMRLLFLLMVHHGDIHYERNCNEDRCPGGWVDMLVDRSKCLVLAWGRLMMWCLVMGLVRSLSSSSFYGFGTKS